MTKKKTAVERVSLRLTHETKRQFDALCKLYKENKSQTIYRIIQTVYQQAFKK
jgi:hypothetical protein